MLRDEMFDSLREADKNDRLPVWVISYNRYDAPTLTRMAEWECLDDVHIVVRGSQADEYRRNFPALRFEPLPDDMINSCGAARWGAYDLAREYGHQRAIMLDDDLLQFRPLYQHHFVRGPNAGMPCSRVFDKEDIAEYGGVAALEEATVTFMGQVADTVFDEEPNAVIGTAIKRLRSFDNRNHQTRYLLNGGSTPRQWTAWELDRLAKNDIRLDLDQFGIVGEDVERTVGRGADVADASAAVLEQAFFRDDAVAVELQADERAVGERAEEQAVVPRRTGMPGVERHAGQAGRF